MTNEEFNNKIIDVIGSIILIIPLVFLFKTALAGVGDMWEIKPFMDLSWRQYWAYSGIVSLYGAGHAAKLAMKKESKSSPFPGIVKNLTYIFTVLFVWGLNIAIFKIWFE